MLCSYFRFRFSVFRLQSNAFLNDSFIESPQNQTKKDNENNQNIINKKSDSVFGTSSLAIISEKGESSAERTNSAKRESTSRQLNFDEKTEEKINKKEPDRPKIALFSKIQSNENSKKLSEAAPTGTSDASWKTKTAETKSVDTIDALAVARTNSAPTKPSDSMLNEHKLCTELQTPKVKASISDSTNAVQKPNADNDDETPYKTFQVPQTSTMRRVQSSSQQRTILSSANQPRKCRNDLEKEFRSQKVLFTTPSAVSRPAMKAMNNLDLDDSLNCYKSSPMVNLSPVREERNKENCKYTAVESMDDLYRSIEKIDSKIDAPKVDDVKVSTSTTSSQNEDKQEKKDKVIRINGKDFVVLNKLGQGGSSSVFLVEHKETKLQCALKVKMVPLKLSRPTNVN